MQYSVAYLNPDVNSTLTRRWGFTWRAWRSAVGCLTIVGQFPAGISWSRT